MASHLSSFLLILSCILKLRSINADVSNFLSYTTPENTAVATVLADLASDSGLNQEYPPEVASTLQLAFVDDSTSLAISFFAMRQQSQLVVTRRVDRDAICASSLSCVLQLDIKVQPPKYFHIIKVNIVITDINDNTPVFSPGAIEKVISESSLPGVAIPIPKAIDLDSPQYGVVFYKLRQPSDLFGLRVTNTSREILDVQLVLTGRLDREVKDAYELDIEAVDSGNNSGSLHVTIRVQDVNDNPPVFTNLSYEFSTPEDIEVGSILGQVAAADADLGVNGVVRYALTSDNPDVIATLFDVDPVAGHVKVIGLLDHEIQASYSFTVSANNDHINSLFSLAKVTVQVSDVNDNAPVILVRGSDLQGAVFIPENSTPNTFVAHLTVSDLDSNEYGQFNCTSNSKDFVLTRLFDTEFKMTTLHVLDREEHPSYHVRILCADFGEPSKWSEKHIEVKVTDINDNPPQFSKPVFTRSILENNTPGEFLVQIRASDADEGNNGSVRFRLQNSSMADLFTIDPVSGNISSLIPFDHEVPPGPIIDFVVVAYDLGDEPLETTSHVVIEVVDVDDEDPTFLKDEYTFGVYENEANDTEVGHVEAIDRDSNLFNHFTYSISYTDDDAACFAIDPSSGRIYTNSALDRESQPVYHILVLASSSGLHVTSSTAQVSIYVADRNDNSPIITFPSPDNSTIHISSRTRRTDLVGTVEASDIDNNLNSRLAYSIISGNEDGYFNMDLYTGAIILEKTVSHISRQTFGLVIAVADNGETQRITEAFLNIIVDKTLPPKSSPIIANTNLTIVISIATTSGIIVIILIIAIVSILKWPVILRFINVRKRKYAYRSKIIDQHTESFSEHRITSGSNDLKDESDLEHYPSTKSADTCFTNVSYEHDDDLQCCTQIRAMKHEKDQRNSQIPALHADDLDSLASNATDSGRGSHGSNDDLPTPAYRKMDAPTLPPRQRPRVSDSRYNHGYIQADNRASPQRHAMCPVTLGNSRNALSGGRSANVSRVHRPDADGAFDDDGAVSDTMITSGVHV